MAGTRVYRQPGLCARIVCMLLGHRREPRIYPPGVERCGRCGRRWHGLNGAGGWR